jgi:hypothetical protein
MTSSGNGDLVPLEPIRELHVKMTRLGDLPTLCHECRKMWPCKTAKLIYTTEELQ